MVVEFTVCYFVSFKYVEVYLMTHSVVYLGIHSEGSLKERVFGWSCVEKSIHVD